MISFSLIYLKPLLVFLIIVGLPSCFEGSFLSPLTHRQIVSIPFALRAVLQDLELSPDVLRSKSVFFLVFHSFNSPFGFPSL
ncbi:hypothetical protein C8R45DRAFT_118357 [Mycena sanguinolenta]|nr:hypothetical protein C8R45DRAFT_118357 [Mycena sanguinolenta]